MIISRNSWHARLYRDMMKTYDGRPVQMPNSSWFYWFCVLSYMFIWALTGALVLGILGFACYGGYIALHHPGRITIEEPSAFFGILSLGIVTIASGGFILCCAVYAIMMLLLKPLSRAYERHKLKAKDRAPARPSIKWVD